MAVVKHQGVKHPAKRGTGRIPVWFDDFNTPFTLQRDVDRLFDEISGDFGILPLRQMEEPLVRFMPQIDIKETQRDIRITAELPGVEKKDIEVTLEGETLRLRGEKKTELEEKTKQSYRLERSYGSFERVVPLPAPVDARKADAHIKKGVLSITLPKTEATQSHEHRIEVKAA